MTLAPDITQHRPAPGRSSRRTRILPGVASLGQFTIWTGGAEARRQPIWSAGTWQVV